MRVANIDILAAESGSASLGANWTSGAIWLGHIANYAIQLVFTGTPAGTFKLQASCDPANNVNPTVVVQQAELSHWTDIADSSQTISAAGNHMWTVQNAGYNWVRIVYTRSSSTGTLTDARVYVKGV